MAQVPRAGRRDLARAAARAVREGAARGPPRPGVLRLRAHRRRRRRAARHVRQARAEPDRGQPAAVLQGRGRRGRGVPLRAGPDQARARPRVQGRHRPVRRQARRLPRPPGHGDQGHAALHRRRAQAVQGRPPVHAAGRQERRDRQGGSRRHRRRGQGRRDRVRLRAARLARRGPHPHAAARVPDADARRRDHAEEARRRAADLRRAAPDDRRGPDARRRARRDHQRDGAARAGRPAPALDPGAHGEPVQARGRHQPPRIPYRETITGQAEGHHRHKKQTGGAGQFGEVSLRGRAARARRRLRVRRPDQGRRDPAPVHPRGAEGRRAGARHGRDRRLSAAGRARHRLRRQAPPGGLEGSRVRLGRQEGVPRRDREGEADRAGADRQRRDHLPRGQHGRHRRRPVVAARPGDRHARPAAGRCSRSAASRRWSSSKATRRA